MTPETKEAPAPVAERLFAAWLDFDRAREDVMNSLERAGLSCERYDDISHDHYDSSLELIQCADDLRLTQEQQSTIWGMGFARCWLNHSDGWETYYSKSGSPDGWRSLWNSTRLEREPKK